MNKTLSIQDIYPLSPMQQGMIFHTINEPHSGVYIQQMNLVIQGKLDTEVFTQSWQHILNRHAALRTCFFVDEAKEPVQIVWQGVKLPTITNDYCHLSSAQQQQLLNEYIKQDRKRGFDPQKAPLMRLAFFQLQEETYHIIWTFHHALMDGWNLALLIKELLTFYEAALRGRPAPALPQPRPYRDYITWLQQQNLDTAEVFWREELRGFEVPNALPNIQKKETLLSKREGEHAYAEASLPLSPSLTRQISLAARNYQVTVNTCIQAAWALLLSIYSGDNDIIFGAVVSGRPPELIGAESMIGLFVNTIPVRLHINATYSVRSWLQQIQAHNNILREHEHTALATIQRWSEVSSETALFESIVVFENYPVDRALNERNPELLQVTHASSVEQTNYPLTIVAIPSTEQLVLRAGYDCTRFTQETVLRILEQIQHLLTQFIAQPEQSLATLTLLTEAEKNQLLQWMHTDYHYPDQHSLHALVEIQASQNPDAIAVVFDEQHLTYTELNRRAEAIAATLHVGPEQRIGLCIDRSLDMIISVLGILKAGAAYLPLDPSYPKERLAFLLQDALPATVITRRAFIHLLPQYEQPIYLVDDDMPQNQYELATRQTKLIHPDNLAYVLYTSGTTGTPKGVLISHRGVVSLVRALGETHQIQPGCRVLQFASINFDISVADIFSALCNGATLYLIPQETSKDALSLHKFLIQQAITHFRLPATFFMNVPNEEIRDIRVISTGGEIWPVSLLKRWAPHRRFFNEYGPTETTIIASHCLCEVDGSFPTLGKPVANTRILLLNQHLQPIPVGAVGEIYIGGIGLARGYQQQPALTAEKFLPDPFSRIFGSRLYKTGDLARFLADGTIEFLGRADNQVKVRGHRIELAEIEAVLEQHPAVHQGVLTTYTDHAEAKRLVAYIVGLHAHNIQEDELRRYVQSKLPEYMQPSFFVFLEKFPLTPNNKIDYKALPSPTLFVDAQRESLHFPRNVLEQTLHKIWQQVLGIKHIDIHDNFFSLGGDSILSLQIVTRVRQAGLQITSKQIFQYPTIALLSTVIDVQSHTLIEQRVITGQLPLLPVQLWFFEQNLPVKHQWNQALCLQFSSEIPFPIVEEAIKQLLIHHDALRIRFTHTQQGWQANNTPFDGTIPLAHINLSAYTEEQQTSLIEHYANKAQESLHIEHGPSVQGLLFETSKRFSSKLVIIIHHLLVDTISWRILLEDLETLCQQQLRRESLQLPAKTTSFQEWATRLHAYAQTEQLCRELPYWERIAQIKLPPLPVNFPPNETSNTVASAQTIRVALPSAETQALLQKVPETYHTQIQDILLTAIALTTAEWQNSHDILLHIEGHGREELFNDCDLSRSVGWHTIFYPLLLHGDPSQELSATIKTTKECIRQVPHHGIGYGLLYYINENSHIQTIMHAIPKAEISFNYLGQFRQEQQATRLLQPVNGGTGNNLHPAGKRAHLLEINCALAHNELECTWTYSTDLHLPQTITHLAGQFIHYLRTIISHCLQTSGGFTPSDFPLLHLNQLRLDHIIAIIHSRQTYQEEARNRNTIQDIYPLSPMQQGMLFHNLYAPESGAYFQQVHMQIRAPFDITAFIASWQYIIDQHAILRTCFYISEEEEQVQIVCQHAPLPVIQHDWSLLSEQEQRVQLAAYIQEDRRAGFQLDRAPLLRLSILRLSEAQYHVTWSFHHALLDGWNIPLLVNELTTAYIARRQGQEMPHFQAERPYRDYIQWLSQYDPQDTEQFWRRYLQGKHSPTSITIKDDTASQHAQGQEFHEEICLLSTQLSQQIHTLGRSHQLTPHTILQGAWALLLSRYSGEHDILFGSVVAGRPEELSGIESMVGLFINTIPVRLHISLEDSLITWLQYIHTTTVELRSYEHTPLIQIQGWSDIPRGTPLFENLLIFENYPQSTQKETPNAEQALQIEHLRSEEHTHYPLTLTIVPGTRFLLRISCDTRYYSNTAMKHILIHLQEIITQFVADPIRPLSSISLLSSAEQQQILRDWNATHKEYPDNFCLHTLFTNQAERVPDAIAATFQEQHISYKALDVWANGLAEQLQIAGIQRGMFVGIYMERSLAMLASMLGILKTGAAYVPLDPSYPQERLQFMVADANLAALFTQEAIYTQYPLHAQQVFSISDSPGMIISTAQVVAVAPQNIAYLIYTSGSTGKPKGTLIPHKALSNFCQSMLQSPGFAHTDIVLALTSLSFDIAVLELLIPLTIGARIHIISREIAMDGPQLAQLLDQLPITIMQATPSTWQMLIESGWTGKRDLKMLCGGEALSPTLANRLYPLGESLWNMYGPTETTIWSALWHVSAMQKTIAIGQAIANTQLYVLDSSFHPTPTGVIGELYIGGEGLAYGYLYRPELTAEKFLPDPFSATPGACLYRTGDLACWRGDGTLECVGRIDHQVKIRGHRIEPGEIETVLTQHETIQAGIVIAQTTVPGEPQLLAYVVMKPGHQLSLQHIRTHLYKYLPANMCPAHIVPLEKLPLTPNGKIDRKALPTIDQTHQLSASSIKARDTLEFQLIKIWEDLLQTQPIGITDNFFDLGGHSMLAVRLLSRLQKDYRQELTLSILFQYPTIASLAILLRQQQPPEQWSILAPLQTEGTQAPIFCVHPSGGTVFCYADLARYLGQDHPFYGLQTPDLDGKGHSFHTISDIVAHYTSAIQSVQAHGPYLLSGWSLGGVIAFAIAKHLQTQGEEIAMLALFDSIAPMPGKQDEIGTYEDTELALVHDLLELFALDISSETDFFRRTPENQLYDLLQQAKKVFAVPEDTSLAQFKRLARLHRTNMHAVNNYHPSRSPLPITLFRAQDTLNSVHLPTHAQAKTLGWEALTDIVEVIQVPGSHTTMLNTPYVQEIARHLNNHIEVKFTRHSPLEDVVKESSPRISSPNLPRSARSFHLDVTGLPSSQ